MPKIVCLSVIIVLISCCCITTAGVFDTVTNLIPNGNGEGGMVSWYYSAGVSSVADDAGGGSKCFQLERSSGGDVDLRSITIKVNGAEQIQVHYAYKAMAGLSGNCCLYVRSFTDSNYSNFLGQDTFVIDANSTNWTDVSQTITAKAGAGVVDLRFMILSPITGAFRVDNVAVYRAPMGFNIAAPTSLYVIKKSSLTEAQRVAVETLQGIVAQTKPEIFIDDGSRYTTYLDDMKNTYGVTYTRSESFFFYMDRYKSRCNGYVLFDFADADSLCAAMSLAGLLKAVAIDISLEFYMTSTFPTLPRLMDCRGKNDKWVYDNYWNQLNHNAIIVQPTSGNTRGYLRDWGTVLKTLSWWNSDYTTTQQTLGALYDNSSAWGWDNPAASGELNTIQLHSGQSLFEVPTDWMLNLSTFAGMASRQPEITFSQPVRNKVYTKNTGVHQVAFMMSDMDNVNCLFDAPNWGNNSGRYANSHRGQFPMGWGMAMSMPEIGPSVMSWWYRRATNNDCFSGYSGLGYMYPSKYPALDAYTTVLDGYMQKADIKTLVILDKFWPNSLTYLTYKNIAGKYTRFDNLRGLFYVDVNGDYARYGGKILWFDGKPMVTCRFTLWNTTQYEGKSRTGLQLANSINALPTDSTSQNGYSFVILHAWSYDLDEIWTTIQDLDSDVKVVTPEEMIEQLYLNTKVAYWPLENDTVDHFRNNNNGVNSGNPVFVPESEAKRGIGAMSFDGVDDYLDCGTSAGSATWLTVAFWLKANELKGQVLIDKLPNDSSGGPGWSIKLRNTGALWFRIGSEGNYQDVVVSGAYAAGQWVHVACTLNENTASVYLNGLLAAERPDITRSVANTAIPLRIGKPSAAAVTEAFNGTLDDVVVYGRPLSQKEIMGLMNNGPCSPSMKGDINKDGSVDRIDIMLLMRNWLTSGPDISADINNDQIVDFKDFSFLSINWQK